MASGWSRLSYSEGAWNTSPDAIFAFTGVQANADINLGSGWSREEWGSGAWNESLGTFITGQGNIFIEDGQELTSTVNTIITTASAPFAINGEQLNISQGEESVIGSAPISITGEDLVSATVDSFAVAAGGAITINTPTFEANVELNNNGIVVGLASFLNITGFPLSANLSTIIPNSENIISITGEELTSTANTITVSAEQILSITGNGVTITSANIVPNSENFISISGNRANANVTTLKFWDSITDNNQENWTNIH